MTNDRDTTSPPPWSAAAAAIPPTEPAIDVNGNPCSVFMAPDGCRNPLGCRVHRGAYCGAPGKIGRCWGFAGHEGDHEYRYPVERDGLYEWVTEPPVVADPEPHPAVAALLAVTPGVREPDMELASRRTAAVLRCLAAEHGPESVWLTVELAELADEIEARYRTEGAD